MTTLREEFSEWWSMLRGHVRRPPRALRGFSDAADFRPMAPARNQRDDEFPQWVPESDRKPFSSIGPHGHRGRMRDRLLTRGSDGLADYEMLEMLLFFAFKRGDTKPLAKALINRFGSFAAVLAAPQQQLLNSPGLGTHSVAAIKLVQAAALRLARAEVMEKPVLNNWDRLMDYLTAVLAREKIEPCLSG